MKKFDKVIASAVFVYLVISLRLFALIQGMNNKSSSEYKVEINRIYLGLVEGISFTEPDLISYKFIKSVSFLPESAQTSKDDIDEFYKSTNGLEYEIKHCKPHGFVVFFQEN